MAEYFRVTPSPSIPESWEEKFWAISESGAVKRTVEVREDGSSLANSLTILSHRSGHFGEYAHNSTDPCLLTNKYQSIAEWKADVQHQGFDIKTITKAEFERRFRTANPDI